jgi:hypothetical protein
VVDGHVAKGDTVVMVNTGKEYTLDEIVVLAPVKTPVSLVCPRLFVQSCLNDQVLHVARHRGNVW